uniref:protein-tyrosine-phosphatase n=1 Tax=Strigamia maritima TaxID=126957 RepID=T1J8T1_STRMM
MNNMEDTFKEIDRLEDWHRLFQQIETESNNYDYNYKHSRKSENLNRYQNVLPYSHNRVKLNGSNNYDYINASYVQVPLAHRNYILTQGPLPHTVSHFWQMTWQQNSKAIVMLTNVIEQNRVKCHQYWPLGIGENHEMILPDVNLKVELTTEDQRSFCTIRRLKLTHLKKTREMRFVLHFHYTTWLDFDIPASFAGIGQSGVFCLVDSCLVLIEECRDSVSVDKVLLDMRKCRMGLVTTPEQLRFAYLAIIEGGKRSLSGIFTENFIYEELLKKNKSNVVKRCLLLSERHSARPPLVPLRSVHTVLTKRRFASVTPSLLRINLSAKYSSCLSPIPIRSVDTNVLRKRVLREAFSTISEENESEASYFILQTETQGSSHEMCTKRRRWLSCI